MVFKNELNVHLEFISEKYNSQLNSPYFKKYEYAEYEKCMKNIYKEFITSIKTEIYLFLVNLIFLILILI